MLVIFTIGHSTRAWLVFLDLLRAYDIKRVIDVRSIPRSRHNPQFNRETLSTKLRSARIGYVHSRKLSGLRRRLEAGYRVIGSGPMKHVYSLSLLAYSLATCGVASCCQRELAPGR